MNQSRIKMEVCVDSIYSAMTAQQAGASRIELCSALNDGGLTPSVGTLKVLKEQSFQLPIFCMIRQRPGLDFCYSPQEMHAMISDMVALRDEGADGFVFGALKADRSIDVERCQAIMARSHGRPVTFHRAFDYICADSMHENVEIIKRLGFARILTSGLQPTAEAGMDNLTNLISHHSGITILPGGGIRADNLESLLTNTKCTEFHTSGIVPKGHPMELRIEQTMDYKVANLNMLCAMASIACR